MLQRYYINYVFLCMVAFFTADVALADCQTDGEMARSAQAIEDLRILIAQYPEPRAIPMNVPFSEVPICKAHVESAASLLWDNFVAEVKNTRQAEVTNKRIVVGEHALRYDFTTFGTAPANGRSLYISMHGGGGAPSYVNDQQWENQKRLYQPAEGIYLSPRAPTDTWNMWHQDHIDPLFQRLITDMVIFHGVDPNRVYIMGYSAGGDGVYQIAPRFADHWAAAAMAAGHPNEASPLGLRNIGFTIHVGELDSAYNRNRVAAEWRDKLGVLRQHDPQGYSHEVQIHPGRGHWMYLEDAVAVPWMANFTRDPLPTKVVWHQDDVLRNEFYWLAVDPNTTRVNDDYRAEITGQRIDVSMPAQRTLYIRLNDAMINMDAPIQVYVNGNLVENTSVTRRIVILNRTLREKEDRHALFSGEIQVQTP